MSCYDPIINPSSDIVESLDDIYSDISRLGKRIGRLNRKIGRNPTERRLEKLERLEEKFLFKIEQREELIAELIDIVTPDFNFI